MDWFLKHPDSKKPQTSRGTMHAIILRTLHVSLLELHPTILFYLPCF